MVKPAAMALAAPSLSEASAASARVSKKSAVRRDDKLTQDNIGLGSLSFKNVRCVEVSKDNVDRWVGLLDFLCLVLSSDETGVVPVRVSVV